MIKDISNEEYHSNTEYISRSGLHEFSKLPYKYWLKFLDPNRKKFSQSNAMLIGSLVHCYILEPENFNDIYAIQPIGLGQSKDDKAQKSLFIEKNKGKEVISIDDSRKARWLADKILSHPMAKKLLDYEGNNEQAYFFNHPLTGTPSKFKPDRETVNANGLILDLKKCRDISEFQFGKDCINYWYHVEAAWYMDGFYAETGVKPKAFVFILVEEETGIVDVRNAPKEMIDLGRKTYQQALVHYEECRQDGYFPAYSNKIKPIQLPYWAFK